MIQVLINSLIYASEIAIIAVGVALTYSILRFANFAHIQYAVIGGYVSYALASVGLPVLIATLASAILTGGLAVVIDRAVFCPLEAISPEGKMIVSFGVALFLRSVLAAIFGGAARVFDIDPAPIPIAGLAVTALDLTVIGVTIAAMAMLHLALIRTKLGTALRALASNRDLAVTRGIPRGRMIALMWFIAGGFAAIGGTLLALETRLQPDMDLLILLPVFAAVTIGGLGNVKGAVIGAIILSFAQNIAIAIDFGSLLASEAWYLPTRFRDAIAVLAMVLVLVLRPSRGAPSSAR